MLKSNKETRITQVKVLINSIPEGRKGAYKRMVQYELAKNHNVVMTESQLSTFFTSGYSTIADTIIEALQTVVARMIKEEEVFQTKVQELQAA